MHMNEVLTALWHDSSMTAITRVDHALALPQPRDHRESNRAAVNFGAAMSQRELMGEKFRVDPIAVADKKRAPESTRARDPPPADARDQRADERRARSEERRKRIDIKA